MDMDLWNAPAGEAFEGDYPESYGKYAAHLREIVARQLAELNSVGSSPRAPELLGILRGRRSGRQDLAQIEVLPRKRGGAGGSLIARGEIVMPADSFASPEVNAVVKARGFDQVAERGGLRVLRHGGAFQARVRETIDEFRREGGAGWFHAVGAMAAVGKGTGGPEPVDGPGAFAAPTGDRQPGPRVAVIDTGIPASRRGDGWLDAVPRDADNVDLLDAFPCGRDGFLDFQAGHGTFVAGIVQRVAPGADIRVYRAADSDGFATDADIAAALRRAYADGARIINLSLGIRTPDDEPPPGLAGAVAHIHADSGGQTVIVAAAGNFGDEDPCWPGSLAGVEAVAGLTAELQPSRWSSHGDHVRFSAVAEGIRSTFVPGNESPVFDREPESFPEDAWALWSGTSFAAPQIAGAIARICQELEMPPREATDLLAERGLAISKFGRGMRILEGVR
ncbi:hypothetical protein Prum_091420 [Phytohabitans rumicis]|uniref:Peptidase S8/S53 domain-containing protein n=1 Tax=Phytohabitans rumicis TaxID=1076125 RepID=A0A6V8LIW4_9ACTN|nr:hypothetical protein Prum_091420 [Phytohabitans rumicis]